MPRPHYAAYINLLGEYDFLDEKLQDSVGILHLKQAALRLKGLVEQKYDKLYASVPKDRFEVLHSASFGGICIAAIRDFLK